MPSKTLVSIVSQQARYAGNVSIQVDRNLDSVIITDKEGHFDDIYIDGEDAYSIIKDTDGLYEEVKELIWHDCCKAICAPYIEANWN